MSYRVAFARKAEDQLLELQRYIAEAASPDIAARYANAIVSYCESLRTFPHRGTRRDDVRPGLRITNYRKRAVIAFDVEADTVSIIGVFYGGQNYEAKLREDSDLQPSLLVAPAAKQ
ncbi:type II toxin-antitoxin system RelE/ParE family toxin [Ramlibacter sp.]|uniref:type II toxin-antitoxin system RelE/ParE family toxin n=1 Tax=Ramlibacter sp. TaxID=1917967 RepID=UPI003D0EE5BD